MPTEYVPITKRPSGYEGRKQDDFVPNGGFPKDASVEKRKANVATKDQFHPSRTRKA